MLIDSLSLLPPPLSLSSLKRRAAHEVPTNVELPAKRSYTLSKYPPPPPRGPLLSPLYIPVTNYLVISYESKLPSN